MDRAERLKRNSMAEKEDRQKREQDKAEYMQEEGESVQYFRLEDFE